MELHQRAILEPEMASRIAALNARQRREFESYLTMTDPPDVRNVPPEAWDRWEKEHRDLLLAILLLIWITSAQQHGSNNYVEMNSQALIWSMTRANESALSWGNTGREMLRKAGAEWDKQRTQWETDIAAARKRAAEHFGVVGLPSFEQGPLSKTVLDEMGIPHAPVNRQDVFDRAANIFGPSRAEAEAITEFTAAQTAGGEWATGVTVGLSDDDEWGTLYGSEEEDSRVCPVCHKLNKTKRPYWSRFFPKGPPAHPRCRCEIVPAAAAARLAVGVP